MYRFTVQPVESCSLCSSVSVRQSVNNVVPFHSAFVVVWRCVLLYMLVVFVIFDVAFTMCSLYFFRNHLEENRRLQRETPEVAHCDERVRKLWRRRQIKALAVMAGRLHCSHRNLTLGASNIFIHWYYFGPAFAISAYDNVKRHNDCILRLFLASARKNCPNDILNFG